MTAPRIIVRGATTAMTRRTVLRKAWLAPWDPLVQKLILYSMADAQRKTGVAIHSSVGVVTHLHTSGTPSKDNLPDFTRRFHRDVSCSVGELLRIRKYDAPRELFDGRPTHMMRLVDAEAQASHAIYESLNPVAAGLVRYPDAMPMQRVDYTVWKKGYIDVERPPLYFASRRPEVVRLYVTPPPLLYEAFGGDLDKLVYHLEKLERDGLAALHESMKRQPMGAQALRRIHPWSEPRTMREPGGRPVPSFRIGACDILGREARKEAAREVTYFRQGHEQSRLKRRDGDHSERFPYGTYAMRVYHGAPVEEAPVLDAIVSAPGPTLDEVKARLADERFEPELVRERSHALVDAVRNAFRKEAPDIVGDSIVDFVESKTVSTPAKAPQDESAKPEDADRADATDDGPRAPVDEATGDDARAPADVRHCREERRDSDARRLITLRDRRRGRPPKDDGGPHGSDPPD